MQLVIEKNINGKIFKFYDFDAEVPYKPGEFNQQFKTSLINKYKILPKTPLKKEIVDSFLNGEYVTVQTTEELILYRIYGEYKKGDGTIVGAKLCGAFASTEFAESSIEVKVRLALDPKWLSTKMYEIKILVPTGTILNIGKVAPMTTLSGTILEGGADQILLPLNWTKDWIVGYRRVTLNQLYKVPVYSLEDPTQQNDKCTLYPHACPICDSIRNIKFSDAEAIHFQGSKGRKYTAHYQCLDCKTFW